MTRRTQLPIALLVALSTIAAACGGGGSDEASEPADTEPEVTEPAETDPPVTEPPTTAAPNTAAPTTAAPTTAPPTTAAPTTVAPEPELPDWASGEIAVVESDTGPIELPVELVGFCETSRSFHIAAGGLPLVQDGQQQALSVVMSSMAVLLTPVFDAAPAEEFRVEPNAAASQLLVLNTAFAEVDFDLNQLATVSNIDEVSEAFDGFIETQASLRSFLIDVCGADADVLDQNSQDVFDIIVRDFEGSGPPPTTEPTVPVATREITNGDSTITVSVPTDWNDIDDSPGSDALVVAEDIDAFTTFDAPGVLVLRGLGGFRDGGFVGGVLGLQSDLEEDGCTLTDELSYDDGLYAGEERVFVCGDNGADVRIFGGTTADESLYAIVVLVQPDGDLGIRQLIADTFQVF